VVTYDVVVLVGNRDLKLMPGMTANVSIIVAEEKGVLTIPNAAIRFRPAESGKQKFEKGAGVWIVEKQKPKRVAVKLGISDGNYTQIISGDLKEGQDVIVESLAKTQQSPGRTGPRMF
jgi:HlyD family secretion protein